MVALLQNGALEFEGAELKFDAGAHVKAHTACVLQNGALEFEGAELKFDAGADGKPHRVEGKANLPMMAVIAEMMIFANEPWPTALLGHFREQPC